MNKRKPKSWKKQWLKELKEETPSLSQSVLDTPIPVSHRETPTAWQRFLRYMAERKGWMKLSAAAASVLILVAACFAFLPSPAEPTPPEPPVSPAPSPAPYAVTVDINPSSAFLTDESGTVVKVVSLNPDADVMQSTDGFEQAVIGLPLQTAIVNYVDLAAKLGYFKLSEDAVKISTSEDNKGIVQLGQVRDSLESYFCDKGIFGIVAFDFPTGQEFSDSMGIKDDAVKGLEDLDSVYSTRLGNSLQNSQLSEIYQSIVTPQKTAAYIRQELKNNVEVIANGLHLLSEITLFNQEIKDHPDNPSLLNGDYWYVKNMKAESRYTEAFAALMKTMETKLADYERLYAVSIDSSAKLNLVRAKYSFLNIDSDPEELKHTLNTLINSEFTDHCIQIFDFLTARIHEEIKGLLNIPKTADEFKSKLSVFNKFENLNREESAKDAYNLERTPISKEEYRKFTGQIQSEYGSLLNYFEKKK